jgi:hypothetical protein
MERETRRVEVHPPPGVASFEFTVTPNFRQHTGSGLQGSSAGSGGSAALRIAPNWQIVVDVNGCRLRGMAMAAILLGNAICFRLSGKFQPSS